MLNFATAFKNKNKMKKNRICVGVVQWEAKVFADIQEFLAEIEYNIRALSAYNTDFILFPEYFSLCLAAHEKGDDWALMKFVAKYSDLIVNKVQQCAVQYKTTIIAGTLPCMVEDKILNISYLCHSDGRIDSYAKTHLTPWERSIGMSAGNEIEVFDTACGKIGILICYDCEFPEAARKLADKGAKLLFVPFQTDTIYGFHRVKRCAQARAIENECYVITSGLVGHLPQCTLVESQYAQSSVFTPSDYFFPANNVLTEATANIATTVVTELDITLLERLHEKGSVRTLTDRRFDIYGINH